MDGKKSAKMGYELVHDLYGDYSSKVSPSHQENNGAKAVGG
jgi:hypothetical protein